MKVVSAGAEWRPAAEGSALVQDGAGLLLAVLPTSLFSLGL